VQLPIDLAVVIAFRNGCGGVFVNRDDLVRIQSACGDCVGVLGYAVLLSLPLSGPFLSQIRVA